MSRGPCLKCGGRRHGFHSDQFCYRCWMRMPKALRDDLRRAVAVHDHDEEDRLTQWAISGTGAGPEGSIGMTDPSRQDAAGLVALEPSRFEYCRTSNWDRVQELGADGWQLACVVFTGEELLHYLERIAEEPTVEAQP